MIPHVISLQRTPQRLAEFRSQNGNLKDYRIFPAIDGSTVDLGQLQAEGYLDNTLIYSLGAIGNALSHIKLWELASASGEVLTIVEDDSLLHHDFCAMSRDLLSQMPRDWDLVMWGWNFDGAFAVDFGLGPSQAIFDPKAMRVGMDRYLRTPVSPPPEIDSGIRHALLFDLAKWREEIPQLHSSFAKHAGGDADSRVRQPVSRLHDEQFLSEPKLLRRNPPGCPYHQRQECQYRLSFRAIAAYQQKNLAEAERLCQELLRVDPRYFEALHLLGVICSNTGRTAQGGELLRRAVSLRPSNPAAHSDLGAILAKMELYDEAMKNLEIAVSLDPTNWEAYANAGHLLQLMGRVSEAIVAFDKALALKPHSQEIARSRATASSRLK